MPTYGYIRRPAPLLLWRMLKKYSDLRLFMLLEATLNAMDRCTQRTRDAVESGDHRAATWNISLREQYTFKRNEILEEMGNRGLREPRREPDDLGANTHDAH
jgi:hypothetical protein